MTIAILQCADTGPLESLVVMLRAVGYECRLPSEALRKELRALGCDTVLDIGSLVDGMGYERPMPLPPAEIEDVGKPGVIYVDVKGHRNCERVRRRWPNLRVLWYRINGGEPEVVPGCGDEVNPPCPVLTPNQWYAVPCGHGRLVPGCLNCGGTSYVRWSPFYRFNEYFPHRGRRESDWQPPVCLTHNLVGWGYAALIDNVRRLGVKCHGAGSPDGLVRHADVPNLLSNSLCMVHLKSSDAPGYSLYEALAAACPVVCTRRLIWRCRMRELFVPGETCLVFDRETHDGLTADDVRECTREVGDALARLSDPAENKRIGAAGRKRLREVMWSGSNPADVESLREFMRRNFP